MELDIEKRYASFSPTVISNTELVVSEEPVMLLHGSVNGEIKEFIPRIGTRQANMEDRTVPRICTSDCVIGCFEAMNELEWRITDNIGAIPNRDKNYKGGWYIYGIETNAYIKPNKKLVYDVNKTNEKWLINYAEQPTYKGVKVAKVFIDDIKYTTRDKKFPLVEFGVVIEVLKNGVAIIPGTVLDKGYYRYTYQRDNVNGCNGNLKLVIKELNTEEYDSIKKSSADMLSYESHTVVSNWAK